MGCLVTVIIPTFNYASYLIRAIESALNQTYEQIEIIVVDDGSTDDTKLVLLPYKDRIHYFSQANSGPSSARNLGLLHASGEYVAFLDADDYWDCHFVALLVEHLQNTPWHDVAYCNWYSAHTQSEELRPHRHELSGDLLRKLLCGNLFPIHAAISRTTAVLNVGGFDPTLRGMEDWDLWLRVALAGSEFGHVDHLLCHYVIHEQSNSSAYGNLNKGRLRALDKFYASSQAQEYIAFREPVYAAAFAQNAIASLAHGDMESCMDALTQAGRFDVSILTNIDVLYGIACANQPIQFRGTGYGLEFEEVRESLIAVLSEVLGVVECDMQKWKTIWAMAELVVGRLAYDGAKYSLALRAFGRALRLDVSTYWRSEGIQWTLRSTARLMASRFAIMSIWQSSGGL